MPRLIGGLTAFVAMAAGIIGGVDPIVSLERALLAFVLGYVAVLVWYAFLGRPATAGEQMAEVAAEGSDNA